MKYIIGIISAIAILLIFAFCFPTSPPEKTQTEYVFKKDVYKKTTKTEFIGSNTNTIEVEYTIEDGIVKEGTLGVSVGKINAYTFTVGDTVYTNTFTNTLKIISIVGVSLGGVSLVLYFVLNNKNSKKKTTKKSSKKK